MTIAEIQYTKHVSSFIGIPYKWDSWDKEIGLDCRTLTVCFLTGLGYDIDGEDGMPMPTETEMLDILKDKDRLKELSGRYVKSVNAKGDAVLITDIQINDIVMYETAEISHIGVYVGDGKLLASSRRHGSLLISLDSIKEAVIAIVRLTKG